jgi:hypothetical protein
VQLKRRRACRFNGVTEIQGRVALVMKYYRLGSLTNAVERSCGGLLLEEVLRCASWCGACSLAGRTRAALALTSSSCWLWEDARR